MVFGMAFLFFSFAHYSLLIIQVAWVQGGQRVLCLGPFFPSCRYLDRPFSTLCLHLSTIYELDDFTVFALVLCYLIVYEDGKKSININRFMGLNKRLRIIYHCSISFSVSRSSPFKPETELGLSSVQLGILPRIEIKRSLFI